MADPIWGKISTTQTDFPTNVTANWYFSWAAVSRLTGRIFHTWNGRDYIYNPSTNLWSAAGSTNNVGWRENYGCCHDSDLNVIHYSPGTSGPTEWSGAIKYDLGSLTWSTEPSTGVGHAAHLWDPTRKTLRNFGGWTSNEALRSRVTNPSGAWTATSPSGTQPPLTQDGSRETCRRAVMDTRNGNMYVLADDRDLYKYTASSNAWSLVSVTGTKPEAFAVLGIHETANMLVAFCGDNSMVQADARVPTRTTRVLDLTALQWKLLATTSNDPLRSIMCQTILMWDPFGDRVICLQTEPGTAYSQVYALTATSVGTPPTLYTVTVTSASTNGGTGSVTGTGAYQAGATVDLTATAASNSTFVNFTQSGTAFAEPFTMPASDVALVANWLLNTPDPPPPPPNDLNLLVRQWTPRPLPGITTNSAPFLAGGQTKDVNGCYDTQRRIMYLGTGDFTGAGGSQSGRPEIFAYRAETNTWSLVSGLSHPAGQITPNHPTDRGPMIYDSLRDRIWLHNAVPFPDTEGQFTPGGSVYMAGLLYLQLSTGVWSFVADRNWSSSLGGGAYDTASDSMLLFEQGGFGPGSGGRLRVVPLTNPVSGGTTYNLTASPTPTWTGAAGGWLVPQQPERTFFAWDNQARVLYIINRQVRLDAAGNVAEQRASMHSFSMVTRTWTMRTHAAALSSSTTLVPYSIFCWWDSNTSRVIWPVVTGPDGLVTQMLAYTPATDTWENMGGSFSNMRANCGFFIPSVNAAIGAGSVFDLTYSQTNLFLWLDGPAPPNTGGDVTAPSCTLTAPASAATISGAAVAVSASATDNVAVSRVDFYFDGALFATDSVAPYAVVLNTLSTTDGQHTISARAVDTSTNVSTFSTVTVTVTNNPTPPSVPPVCTITSHATNDTVSDTITVVGTITDADGVLMGELLVNGVLHTKQDFGPSYSWDVVTTAYADGPLTLKIKGTDNSAAHDVGFSATVTVNVVNTSADITAPVVTITSPAPAAVLVGTETVLITATDAVGVVGGVDLYVDGVKVLTAPASQSAINFPSSQLGVLAGPLTVSGATAYDAVQLSQAADWADNNTTSDSFYDRALTYYLTYYRTGDSQWLTTANAAAVVWADYTVANLTSESPPGANQSARDYATLGLAIHYLLTGYANSLTAVRAQAISASRREVYGGHPTSGSDAREAAYDLIAMLATTILGGDPISYMSTMSTRLNAFLSLQGQDQTSPQVQPNSGWQSWSGGLVAGDGFYILNYMDGLVIEALILYDRVVGDARIVPAIKNAVDWTWSTQWVALGGGPTAPAGHSLSAVALGAGSKTFTTTTSLGWTAGDIVMALDDSGSALGNMHGTVTSCVGTTLIMTSFAVVGSGTPSSYLLLQMQYPGDQTAPGPGCMQYGNINSGSVNTQSDEGLTTLMGLLLLGWGYLYARGQGATYKTNGNTILAALGDVDESQYFLAKQFPEAYRSSPRYLGFVDVYALDLNTLPLTNDSHALVAKARDAAGNIGTSATVTVTVNNTIPPPSDVIAPVVSVLTPAAGSVTGTISLTASATDNVAVTFVSYYLDGVKLTGDFATPPYTRALDTTGLTAGPHSIQARARDADLNEGVSALVQIIVPAPALPVVCAITSPEAGAVLSGTQSVVCTASHADGVARVDLWFRGLAILTLDATPFTFSVDTTLYADGPGIFQVRGYTSGGGNEGLGTADVPVTINNAAPPTTGPTIVITSPSNGENVSGTIDVVVRTTGSPVRVVVDVGGVPLSVEASDLELLTDTPTIPVDTERVPNGLQPIIAHAYGIGALVGHSQTIYVTIGNAIPEVVTATAQQTTGGQDLWRNTARGFRRRSGRRRVHV